MNAGSGYTEKILEPDEVVPPLPFPVHFIHRKLGRWEGAVRSQDPPLPVDLWREDPLTADSWALLSYLFLKRRGHDVRISDHFPPGEICVAHSDDIIWKEATFESYVVGIRADRGPVRISQLQLVQTPTLADGVRSHFIPYWPQPGLQPRDPQRGSRVERIGFMGVERNLAEPFRSPSFKQALEKLGMQLVVRSEKAEWHEYRDLDVILAIRAGNPRWLMTKPPSKLTNAWHAGCPALLGREPAFEALHRSELDFLPVATPEDALRALLRLREGDLYLRMVDNGRMRAAEFTNAHTARRWEELLMGPVAQGYERWRRSPRRLRRSILFARFVPRALLQRALVHRYRR